MSPAVLLSLSLPLVLSSPAQQNSSLAGRVRRSSDSQPCVHGDNWCEHPVDYPDTFIKQVTTLMVRGEMTVYMVQVLNRTHPLWSLLQQNSLPPPHHRHHHRHSHRQPRLLQETSHPACHLLETFVRPRAARNTDLEWRFIVNELSEEDTEYQQVVRVGRCDGTHHECSGSWPGQVTQCRQQYLDHKLVVLSMAGEVLLDTFSFPSCCACHVLNIEYK